MTKVIVLYCSPYGHTEPMAQAVAEGLRETGAEADINRSSFNVAAAIDGVFS